MERRLLAFHFTETLRLKDDSESRGVQSIRLGGTHNDPSVGAEAPSSPQLLTGLTVVKTVLQASAPPARPPLLSQKTDGMDRNAN